MTNTLNILTPYDQKALEEIEAWKTKPVNKFKKKLLNLQEKFLDGIKKQSSNFIDDETLEIIEKVFKGILCAMTDAASYSIKKNGVYQKFRNKGFAVNCAEDILALDLKDIDNLTKHLDIKYKAGMAIEGGASSFASLPGIAFDIVASIMVSLRAISEYATYYGFPPESIEERTYVLYVLLRATSPSDSGKSQVLIHLEKVAREILRGKTWQQLNEYWFVKLAQEVAKLLGIRLTKNRLLKTIPMVGAGVGAGANYFLLHKVCLASYYLYRERFLYQKYNL